MLRLLYILLISTACFHALPLYAQQNSPAAFANTYRFTPADSVTGYNYMVIYAAPSGRRYMAPYGTHPPGVLGNNWYRPLPQLDSFSYHNLVFYEPPAQKPSDVTAWAANQQRIYLLKGDTVHRIWRTPFRRETGSGFRTQEVFLAQQGFYFLQDTDSGYCLASYFSFEDQQWQPVRKWVFPAGSERVSIMPDTVQRPFAVVDYPDSSVLYRAAPGGLPARMMVIPHRYGGIRLLLSPDWFYTISTPPGQTPKRILWRQGKPTAAEAWPTAPYRTADFYDIQRLSENRIRPLPLHPDAGAQPPATIWSQDGFQALWDDPALGAYYISTINRPLRVFPWLRQYPSLYGGTNSAATFCLAQDSLGTIWAGSYNGALTRIAGDTTLPFPLPVGRMMNAGGQWLAGKLYLVEEGREGLAAFTPHSRRPGLSEGWTGFYIYLSRSRQYLYMGMPSDRGLWRTRADALAAGRPQWEKMGVQQGIRLGNILTITEDTVGRIWCAHSVNGMAVYDPAESWSRTWRTDEGQGRVSGMASLTDSLGTVWIGGNGSLWYYNNYRLPPSPQSCGEIRHPLLAASQMISALTIWQKDWLLITASDRVLLLDLKTFYRNGEVKLRYLNPQEGAFTAITEQNAMLTSHTDGTVWFSTSDNVYQWDVARWMALPQFHTTSRITIHADGSEEQLLNAEKPCVLEPGLRTFQIQVALTSPDALPRYMRTAMVREGDSIIWNQPSLQSIFTFNNAAPGHYQFLVEVFEPDGSTQQLNFRLHLKPHFWHTIWFWALVILLITGATAAILLSDQKARTRKAELVAYRSEQEKKAMAQDKQLSELRLLTMSNQFRPHFILNALNTIGSRMRHDERTERVLASLGNSINIIFNNAKRQGVLHPFKEEWKLVTEVIQIHRLMYLPQLRFTLPDHAELRALSGLMVPLGLLQVPVENALLHGLGNRQEGPYELHIGVLERAEDFEVVLTDTGVGRPAAWGMSNATGHGTGTKNLSAMLDILSENGPGKIRLEYTDEIYVGNKKQNSKFGTRVIIIIPKSFAYGRDK